MQIPGSDPTPMVGDIAVMVQTAIGPIFLLVAVASLLGVMTQRLGRVVDRARQLERDLDGELAPEQRAREVAELNTLAQRITFANRATVLCAIAGLLICLVVALLFVGAITQSPVRVPVAGLFITTMAALILGLTQFVAEVTIAARALRVRAELLRS